jgi:ELWxxDGT repeat protein
MPRKLRLLLDSRVALAALAFGTFSAPATAQPAALVRDLNTRTGAVPDTDAPRLFGSLGGRATFLRGGTAADPVVSLWTSDGTGDGTRMLALLCSEPPCASPSRRAATALGLDFYLAGNGDGSPVAGRLWRTDGTAAGTFALTPFLTQVSLPAPEAPQAVHGRLVFGGCDEAGCALWASDGTAAGTRKIRDGDVGDLAVAGGDAYFFAFGTGADLYRSDGTARGTVKVRTLPAGYPWLLTAAGARVFFMTGDYSGDLWTSDGTRDGTHHVETFAESGHDFLPRVTNYLEAVGGEVVFIAARDSGAQLWRSDGTRAGTKPLTAFPRNAYDPGPRGIAVVRDRVYFIGNDGVSGPRLWQTRLSLASTAPVTGCTGGCPTLRPGAPLLAAGERVYFSGRDVAHGGELWVSDGSGGGTHPLADLCPGPCDAAPFDLAAAGGAIYAAAAFADHTALLRSDGSAAGTVELAALPGGDGTRLDLAAVATQVFFAGTDPASGAQPWTSDGTLAGTHLLRKLAGAAPSSDPGGFAAVGSRLLFAASDGVERGLWGGGPSAAGVEPLTATGALGAEGPGETAVAGGLAYFVAAAPDDGTRELWRSDGTRIGTLRLASFPRRDVHDLRELSGRLVFVAGRTDGAQPGFALWTSDGTAAGTVERVVLPAAAIDVPFLAAAGGALYFAVEYEDRAELYTSDGTAAGTRPLLTPECACGAGFTGAGGIRFVPFAGRTYFSKWGDGEDFSGPALWRTDGTPQGTEQILPPPEGPQPVPRLYFPDSLFALGDDLLFLALTPRVDGNNRPVLFRLRDGRAQRLATAGAESFGNSDPQFVALSGRAYFRGFTPDNGYELWTSDGSPQGTRLVRDLFPGRASSDPQGLTVAAGRLYFSAFDPEHGRELWVSDGTAAGTRRLQDIAPGTWSSDPRSLTVAGGRLYFTADDGTTGRELWSLELTGAGARRDSRAPD